MNQEVKMVVLIEVQPGKAEEQIEAFNHLKPLVLAEAGCLEYELYRVKDSEVQFVLSERWLSEEALAAHHETPHMKEAGKLNPTFRAKPSSVMKLEAI